MLTYTDDYTGFALFVSHDNPDPLTRQRCASAISVRLRRLSLVPTTLRIMQILLRSPATD